MGTIYTVSPTNFQIVSAEVAGGLSMTVGQSGRFSNGITLAPKTLDSSFQRYVQIGLTLPQGTLENFSLNYACSGSSFITQINVLQVTSAGNSSMLWFTQNALSGSGVFAPDVSAGFTGSLDLTVGVVFRSMNETIEIGGLSFAIA